MRAGHGPPRAATLALLGWAALALACGPGGEPLPGGRRAATGPLVVHPENPRYFADAEGRPVYLTGSHTWANLVDSGWRNPPEAFDYPGYLDALERYNHNCFRLWAWEQASGSAETPESYWFRPLPFLRTGPGTARDGLPRFDLERLDERYFQRLRSRVQEAQRRGFYVIVMLFNGWSIESKGRDTGNPWPGHPFHRDNNVNGIDADLDGDGEGRELHTLAYPAATRIQEAYLRRVVTVLNGLDNVLWEVSNESHAGSLAWQRHMAAAVRRLEATLPRQHPVGISATYPDGGDDALWESPVDWVAPSGGGRGGGLRSPAVADGRKVLLADSDHLCGVCGDPGWPWRALTRGQNPLLMDPWEPRVGVGTPPGFRPHNARWERMRRALGQALHYANRIDLAALEPRPELCSSGYCLGPREGPVRELLAYLPEGGEISVDLSGSPGSYAVEWFHPAAGARRDGEAVGGGAAAELEAPCDWTVPGLSRLEWRDFLGNPCGEAVLYLRRSGT